MHLFAWEWKNREAQLIPTSEHPFGSWDERSPCSQLKHQIEEMLHASWCHWAFLGQPLLLFREEKDSELGNVEVECSLGSCDHFCPPTPHTHQPHTTKFHVLFEAQRKERETAEFPNSTWDSSSKSVWPLVLNDHSGGARQGQWMPGANRQTLDHSKESFSKGMEELDLFNFKGRKWLNVDVKNKCYYFLLCIIAAYGSD